MSENRRGNHSQYKPNDGIAATALNSTFNRGKAMNISQNCLDIVKKWEGFKLEAYLDPVGIPTIGYGTIRYPDTTRVKLGDRISEPQAEAFLKFEIDATVKSLNVLLQGIDLNQNQFDAVVSLCYNIGVGAFSGSTILRKLREGDFTAAAEAFKLWNKGTVNGKKVVIDGLTNRRADERALFARSGRAASPIVTEESPQDRVNRIEAFRDGHKTVLVAFADDTLIEILELEDSRVRELTETIGLYRNLKSFQIAPPGRRVPAGGRIAIGGPAIVAAAGSAPAMSKRLLQFGSEDRSGETDVSNLQRRLKELGYYNDGIDGDFGKLTDAAVREFQTAVFGSAEADGKVGPKTWQKLWGEPVAPLAAPTATPVAGGNFLKLTRTNVKESFGCYRLQLEYFKKGMRQDSMFVVSGQPKRQFFRTGKDSRRGSYEPLPEGKWRIRNILWAGGPDVYDKKMFKDGIGPVKIPVDFNPKSGTDRDLIQIHIDWNRSTAPGTAGCIGVASVADFKRLVGWLRDTDPRELIVDWKL